MKFFTFGVILALFIVSCSGKKRCKEDADCDKDECCVMEWLFWGKCQKHAKEEQPCSYEAEVSMITKKYVDYCPCIEGLECVPQKEKKLGGMVIKFHERCINPLENTTPTDTDDTITTSTDEETTISAEDETTVSAEDETTASAEDETTASAEDETTASAEDETTVSAEDE